MNPLIPAWIIGGPFIGLLILSFSFKGSSAMGGEGIRLPPRTLPHDPSEKFLDAIHPDAPRRIV